MRIHLGWVVFNSSIHNSIWVARLSLWQSSSLCTLHTYLVGVHKLRWQVFWGFDQLPSVLTFSNLKTLTKTRHDWTTYPLLLVNVVCERPLTRIYFYIVEFILHTKYYIWLTVLDLEFFKWTKNAENFPHVVSQFLESVPSAELHSSYWHFFLRGGRKSKSASDSAGKVRNYWDIRYTHSVVSLV